MRPVGDYLRRSTCRLCQGTDLVQFLDFGQVPLAGGFLKEEQLADEKFYPLELHFCRDCTLVQVTNVVPGEVLFRNYFYFSSAIHTLVDHFSAFATEMTDRFLTPGDAFVVEVGCNDGVLLKPLTALGVKCVGVDPATNVVGSIDSPEITVINDFFTEELALQIRDTYGQADAVLSSYSLAHIDDMVDVIKGVKTLLKDSGVLVFEVYYLGTLMDELQYDMIYHEHLNYYSTVALINFFQRFQMEIFDVRRMPLRAGTMRYYVRNIGERSEPVSPAVEELLQYEREEQLDSPDTYFEFGEKVYATRSQLMDLLNGLKQKGQKIIGYGASGRATTIMNFCNIDSQLLDYVVDDAPAKQGFYTPGTHLPIKPWSATDEPLRPDYVLLFAWSFLDEVLEKRTEYLHQGGKFVVPLPEPRVISG